jgi:hypothetical protein
MYVGIHDQEVMKWNFEKSRNSLIFRTSTYSSLVFGLIQEGEERCWVSKCASSVYAECYIEIYQQYERERVNKIVRHLISKTPPHPSSTLIMYHLDHAFTTVLTQSLTTLILHLLHSNAESSL